MKAKTIFTHLYAGIFLFLCIGFASTSCTPNIPAVAMDISETDFQFGGDELGLPKRPKLPAVHVGVLRRLFLPGSGLTLTLHLGVAVFRLLV